MVIQTEGLTKEYGGKTVFRNLDLCFESGKLYMITGRSGEGKSTLLNILGLLDDRYTGICRYSGKDVRGMSDRERSRLRNEKTGFIFQSCNLIGELSILDNLMLPFLYSARLDPVSARERAGKLAAQFGFREIEKTKAGILSGGGQQRIAAARALLMDPPVIFADEPTGNLDRGNTEILMDCLDSRRRDGKLVIMVTHDMRLLSEADEVIEMRPGSGEEGMVL